MSHSRQFMEKVILSAGSVITIYWLFQQFLTANSTNNAESLTLTAILKQVCLRNKLVVNLIVHSEELRLDN